MRIKRNNKGFTLVELLITIAIMITILLISIRSITGASSRKKSEAYEAVEKQIISAAEQYIDSNEYLFTDENKSKVMKIPIGLLVSSGYLNKLVDPRDGKTIDECYYVEVTNENGNIKIGKFVPDKMSDKGSCKLVMESNTTKKSSTTKKITSSKTTVKTSKTTTATLSKPALSLSFNKKVNNKYKKVTEDTTGWYNKKTLGNEKLVVKIEIEKDKNDSVEVYRCYTKDEKKECSPNEKLKENTTFYDDEPYKNDIKYRKVCYKLESTKGKKLSSDVRCIAAKVDREPPTTWVINEKDSKKKVCEKCSNVKIFDDFKTKNISGEGTIQTVQKRCEGDFSYSKTCKDSTSGVAKRYVRWDLSSTSSKYKNTLVNTGNSFIDKNVYDKYNNGYKFTNSRDDEMVIYAKKCVDIAGNESDTFKIAIIVKTGKYSECN